MLFYFLCYNTEYTAPLTCAARFPAEILPDPHIEHQHQHKVEEYATMDLCLVLAAILANEMGNELPGGIPYLAVVRVISAFQDR